MAGQLARAEATARRAIEIAPRLGSAHVTLAAIEGVQLKFRQSLQHLHFAVTLSPEDPFVLTMALLGIIYLGNDQEALRVADRVTALDPLNSKAYQFKAELLKVTRRFPQAIEALREALKLAPNLLSSRTSIAENLILMDRPAEATGLLLAMPADYPYRLAAEGIIAARSHDVAGAERSIGKLRQIGGDALSYQIAQISAQAGDRDRAFATLEIAVEAKDPGLITAKRDPFLDPIRRDPRYGALIRRLNFP
jgi:serine/threonine-protein kinase